MTGDLPHTKAFLDEQSFNSRPSCDGRLTVSITGDSVNVSIHARRVTGDPSGISPAQFIAVSIHARRVTGDIHGALQGLGETFQFTPVV